MEVKFMKNIVLILIFAFSSGSLLSQSWWENFNRTKSSIAYESLSIEEQIMFDGNKVPNRVSKLNLSSFSIGFGVYLPVYEIIDNLSLGVYPQISMIAGGAAREVNNNGIGGSSNDAGSGGLAVAAFKFLGTVELKWGADASLKKGTSKFGVGLGAGYLYDLFVGLLKVDYQTPVLKADITYMFKEHYGICVNGIIPFSTKTILDNYTIYGYSCGIGFLGAF